MRRPEVSQGAKLAYARLAQYEGKFGECFPKQKTLAPELGVCERTAHRYVHELIKFKLVESERPGMGASNKYFFLEHPWMREGQRETPVSAGEDQKDSSVPDRWETSAPMVKENQVKGESDEAEHTHGGVANGIPRSVEEAVEVALQLGIEAEFARQEFHAKKSVGWKDGYGNPITSWPDHLQARWSIEQRKRTERRSAKGTSAKRPPSPPRQFDSGDYQQPVEQF